MLKNVKHRGKAPGGLAKSFNRLTAGLDEYAELMINYAFYYIKNVLTYKLVHLIGVENENAARESVSAFRDAFDKLALDNKQAVTDKVIPDANGLIITTSDEDVLAFQNAIFIAVDEKLHNDIYAAFCNVLNGHTPVEEFEYESFYDKLVKADKAYRKEAFGMWLGELKTRINLFKAVLSGDTERFVKAGLYELESQRNSYYLSKAITENELMAAELKTSIGNIILFYEGSAELLNSCDNAEIIKGIYDTLVIKSESIEESRDDYIGEARKKLAEYRENTPVFSKEELACLTDWVYERLCRHLDEELDQADINEILGSVYESPHFLAYKERLAKYTSRAKDMFSKSDISYKKDSLLYEISTFTEIMNYSVSRLKESQDALELEFVSVCEGVANEISIIMQKNNILCINPAPHDMFNGKEHEVLLAEKNDAFSKGEIIKVLNPGYKQGDIILIRANVIAAR